jgi:hypothetical protein
MATKTEKLFLMSGRQIGSVFVLPPEAAIQMIQYCLSNGIDVLGIEGFRVIEDRIQPQQEHSCDFDEDVSQRNEQLTQFLTRRLETDLWFEVVTNEDWLM